MTTALTVIAIAIMVIAYYVSVHFYEAYKRREALKRWTEKLASKADIGPGDMDGFG